MDHVFLGGQRWRRCQKGSSSARISYGPCGSAEYLYCQRRRDGYLSGDERLFYRVFKFRDAYYTADGAIISYTQYSAVISSHTNHHSTMHTGRATKRRITNYLRQVEGHHLEVLD